MKLHIVSPIKMLIKDISEDEYYRLKKKLTFMNKNVQYRIKQLKRRYGAGSAWMAEQIARLESELYNTLLWQDKDGFYTRPALKHLIESSFKVEEVLNDVVYPEFKLIPWHTMPEYEPHKAQREAIERLLAHPHSNIEFATGTGKSFIIMNLIKNTGLPTVVSTPSISIAQQLYNQAQKLFGKPKVGLFGDGKRELGKHILIAVGKSLGLVQDPEELEKFKQYQVLISDESHTLPANTFEYFCHTVLGHCPYRWFVSGTQERTAGDDLLLHSIIGRRVHQYTIQQAIDDGILAKLDFKVIDVVSSSSYRDSNNVVRMNQEHLYSNETIARFIASLARQAVLDGKPILILVDEHAQEALLRKYMTVEYGYACAQTDVVDIVRRFNSGELMCLVGTSAISTGTDIKPVRITVNWQGNRSGIKVKQGAIGRSTRLDPSSGKKECLVVDFRVVNVPLLKMHADKRIQYYQAIGPVSFISLKGV